MIYYLDTEFLCTEHSGVDESVELLSIGILREDGESLYRITQFDLSSAYLNDWIRDNVLTTMFSQPTNGSYKRYKELLASYGKSREIIRNDITDFISREKLVTQRNVDAQFIAYYGAYDWVLFCQLFGGLMNLPKGYAYHYIDLRALFDVVGVTKDQVKKNVPQKTGKHNPLVDCEWNKEVHQYLRDMLGLVTLGSYPEKPSYVAQ